VDPGSLAAALAKLGVPATTPPPAEPRAAEAPKPNSWEARKAALLAADGIELPPEPASRPAARPIEAGSRAPLDEAPLDGEEQTGTGLQPLPDAPPALDVAHATAGQFREAILERDHYIELLRRHLHTVRAFEPLPVRITGLDELPPEQRQQIEAWERELQEKHRRTEIDLSLERARLSRDQTNLRQQQEQIRKELRRLGLQNESDGEPEAASPAHDDESAHQHKSSARWLRFLGGGKRNDADRASE
jgi:hypothetical protein